MNALLIAAALSTNTQDPTAWEMVRDASVATLSVVAVVWLVHMLMWIFIAKKAGYSGWWGFWGVLFPPFGLVLFILFGILKWPALTERDTAFGVLEGEVQ
jgi:hypothetical protein